MPTYTKLDLATPINKLLDDAGTALAALPQSPDRIKKMTAILDKCYKDAVAEVDRQCGIYLQEETDYVNYIKQLHADSKQASANLIATVNNLKQNWSDAAFGAMTPLLAKLTKNKTDAHNEAHKLGVHAALRANWPWNEKKTHEVLVGQRDKWLHDHFLKERQPGIDITGDIKTFIVKLDEFEKRGDDCVKAAMALKTQAANLDKTFKAELTQMQKEADRLAGDANSHRSHSVKNMQTFVVAVNQKKVDATQLKAAEKTLQVIDIQLKNDKTYLKTLQTSYNNLDTRTRNAPPAADVKKTIDAIGKTLQDMGGDIAAVISERDTFVKKIAEAKKTVKT